MIYIVALLIIALFVTFGVITYLVSSRNKLGTRLTLTEGTVAELQKKLNVMALNQEPNKLRREIEAQWQQTFKETQKDFEAKLQKIAADSLLRIDKCKASFDAEVQKKYKEACDSISFHTVEYKKTITKKRKQVSRKTPATKAQKIWRDIDEDE